MTKSVKIANPGILTYVLSAICRLAREYFAVTAYTTANVQSDQSAVASNTIN